MNQTAGPKNSSDERLFLWIAIVVALFFLAGGIFLMTALNRREKNSVLPPSHPRWLADFSLTNCTGREVTRAELDGKILAVSFLASLPEKMGKFIGFREAS